ncbi:oligosaccharide flippase family protein [uncultured Draconibacterium sp.]|uniref:oligosaccharide flippase family protein n=1 Tax=uncultured Draconibacterium sp. TaxID=1573823 RepID=UPI002AA8A891|nr:oligosaccharide flippase family protein [uncultured Draconibacterium sp.]
MKVNQLKAGAILSYGILALSNLVALLYTPYMLRMMGQSEYGLYSIVASVMAYLTVLDFGLGNTIVRYTAKYRAEGKSEQLYSMFGMFVLIYSVIGLIAMGMGIGLYFNIESLYSAALTPEELRKVQVMILLMTFNLTFTFPFSIFNSVITAYENFIYQRLLRMGYIIFNTTIMIVLLEMGYRAIGMVALMTVLNVITQILNFLYCRYKIKIKIHFKGFQKDLFREIAGYSFYIFLGVIVDRLYWSSGQLILGATIGTAAVAVFAVAIQLQQMYRNFSTAIPGVFLPKITAMSTRESSDKEISDLFIRTGRIQFTILSIILFGFILFGQQFVVLWAGSDYAETYIIALLLIVPLTVPLIQNIGITILLARNKVKFRSLFYIALATFSVIVQLLLVDKYEGIGSAAAIALGMILGQWIGMNIYYYKKERIDIPRFWREIGKMAIAPLLLGATTFVILRFVQLDTVVKLSGGIILFVAVYLPVFWKMSMNQYERNLIYKPIQKVMLKIAKR